MWIPFFRGFMFKGVMNVLPPKESRFLYPLPARPNRPSAGSSRHSDPGRYLSVRPGNLFYLNGTTRSSKRKETHEPDRHIPFRNTGRERLYLFCLYQL